MAAISEGFTTKQSLWDRLVLDDARVSIMGTGAGTVRGIIVSGGGHASVCLAVMEADIALYRSIG